MTEAMQGLHPEPCVARSRGPSPSTATILMKFKLPRRRPPEWSWRVWFLLVIILTVLTSSLWYLLVERMG